MRLVTFIINWEEISVDLKNHLHEVHSTIEKLQMNKQKLGQIYGQANELVNAPLDSAIEKMIIAENDLKKSISHLVAMLKEFHDMESKL
jgi:hypothetical protein